MTHPLEAENRALEAALESWFRNDMNGDRTRMRDAIAAYRAALAAEPASGEEIARAATVPCVWDNRAQQYVPSYSYRGVELKQNKAETMLARLAAELRVGDDEMDRAVEAMRAKCEAIAREHQRTNRAYEIADAIHAFAAEANTNLSSRSDGTPNTGDAPQDGAEAGPALESATAQGAPRYVDFEGKVTVALKSLAT